MDSVPALLQQIGAAPGGQAVKGDLLHALRGVEASVWRAGCADLGATWRKGFAGEKGIEGLRQTNDLTAGVRAAA